MGKIWKARRSRRMEIAPVPRPRLQRGRRCRPSGPRRPSHVRRIGSETTPAAFQARPYASPLGQMHCTNPPADLRAELIRNWGYAIRLSRAAGQAGTDPPVPGEPLGLPAGRDGRQSGEPGGQHVPSMTRGNVPAPGGWLPVGGAEELQPRDAGRGLADPRGGGTPPDRRTARRAAAGNAGGRGELDRARTQRPHQRSRTGTARSAGRGGQGPPLLVGIRLLEKGLLREQIAVSGRRGSGGRRPPPGFPVFSRWPRFRGETAMGCRDEVGGERQLRGRYRRRMGQTVAPPSRNDPRPAGSAPRRACRTPRSRGKIFYLFRAATPPGPLGSFSCLDLSMASSGATG